MAPTLNRWTRSSWSPIRCRGTRLPANVLLMAKLVILSLLAFSEWRHFKVPFLPFVSILDSLRSFDAFPVILSVGFFFGSLLVLFNRCVRTGCLMVGLTILIAILAGRIEYRNHAVFASFMLILSGLHDERHGLALLRLQVAIIYFGAALNKLLDPDWLSGQFFEFWTHERLRHYLYLLVASHLPPLMLSKLFSWVTILLEFSIAIGFTIPRFYSRTVWLGIFMHGSIMVFTIDSRFLQGPFAYFLPAVAASYLVFFPWPKLTGDVRYDPGQRFSLWLRGASRWIDWDRFFVWRPLAKPVAAGRNRPYLELKVSDKTYEDFKAVKVFLLLSPLTYIAIVSGFLFLFRVVPIAVGLIGDSRYIPFGAALKTLYVLIPVVFFFPLFNDWIDSLIKILGGTHRSGCGPKAGRPGEGQAPFSFPG